MWAGKFLDARTGAVHSSYRRADGKTGSVELLDEALASAQAALPVLDRKADAPLLAAVRARRHGQGPARGDLAGRRRDSRPKRTSSRHIPRSSGWLAARFPATLEQARALRAELWEARQAIYAAAADAVEAQVNALGGSVAYVSTSAPLVFVDVPSDGVAALAERPEVLSLGLEQGWRTFMSSAGTTVGANWTSRERRPGQRSPSGGGRVRQRREHRRPRRAGRQAPQHERTDRDPHPSNVGRGRRRQHRAPRGGAWRLVPAS